MGQQEQPQKPKRKPRTLKKRPVVPYLAEEITDALLRVQASIDRTKSTLAHVEQEIEAIKPEFEAMYPQDSESSESEAQ